MRVLVTRAVADAERTAARLARLRHAAILSPVIEITPTGVRLPDDVFDAVIATSAHAFAGLSAPSSLAAASLLVVGARTADAARQAGFGAAGTVAPDVQALVAAIETDFPEPFRFLYLAGRDRKPDLETALARQKHETVVVETYEARAATCLAAAATDALVQGRIDAILHFSPRSAALFRDLVAATGLDAAAVALCHIAISDEAAKPLRDKGWRVRIAASPDEAAMFACLNA